MRGVNIAMDPMAKDIMAKDIMATAARRRQGSHTCKEAAKLEFPTEKKSRHAYKKECKASLEGLKNGH